MAGLLSLFKKKKTPAQCSAVVVAAGSARRMEGIDKVLAPLGELPVLVHTLYAFQDCPSVDEIVVVTREDLLVEVGALCREYGLDKVTKVVTGGARRMDSVRAGLREISPEAGLIAIHDGARPLVHPAGAVPGHRKGGCHRCGRACRSGDRHGQAGGGRPGGGDGEPGGPAGSTDPPGL